MNTQGEVFNPNQTVFLVLRCYLCVMIGVSHFLILEVHVEATHRPLVGFRLVWSELLSWQASVGEAVGVKQKLFGVGVLVTLKFPHTDSGKVHTCTYPLLP